MFEPDHMSILDSSKTPCGTCSNQPIGVQTGFSKTAGDTGGSLSGRAGIRSQRHKFPTIQIDSGIGGAENQASCDEEC